MKDSSYKVRLLPHLTKFVTKEFFEGQTEPFKIREDSVIGKAFIRILMDKRKQKPNSNWDEYTHSITVYLSQDMMDHSPRAGRLEAINQDLHHLFKMALLIWIRCNSRFNIKVSESIRTFLDSYGIEEAEYPHATAYKLWQRHQH